MARIFKNKTLEEVTVSYGTINLPIEANSQADLSLTFQIWQLASSETLLALLAQGTDKYQLNDGVSDFSVVDAINLIMGYQTKYPETEGYPVFYPSFQDTQNLYPKKNMFTGWMTAHAGAITFYDTQVTIEKRLNGGEMWVYDDDVSKVNKNDIIEFSVIDKDDVLGYFSYYGLSKENGDVLELCKFMKNQYIKVGSSVNGYYRDYTKGVLGTNKVIVGLYTRIGITNVGTENYDLIANLFYLEAPQGQ